MFFTPLLRPPKGAPPPTGTGRTAHRAAVHARQTGMRSRVAAHKDSGATKTLWGNVHPLPPTFWIDDTFPPPSPPHHHDHQQHTSTISSAAPIRRPPSSAGLIISAGAPWPRSRGRSGSRGGKGREEAESQHPQGLRGGENPLGQHVPSYPRPPPF